jgi:hypothetical protein
MGVCVGRCILAWYPVCDGGGGGGSYAVRNMQASQ